MVHINAKMQMLWGGGVRATYITAGIQNKKNAGRGRWVQGDPCAQAVNVSLIVSQFSFKMMRGTFGFCVCVVFGLWVSSSFVFWALGFCPSLHIFNGHHKKTKGGFSALLGILVVSLGSFFCPLSLCVGSTASEKLKHF